MTILDGKKAAEELTAELATKVSELKKLGIVPRLCVFSSEQDIPSKTYVAAKEKKALKLGIGFTNVKINNSTTARALENLLEEANGDQSISAIVVQLPLPESLKESQTEILSKIDAYKDVDGLNTGSYLAPTPAAIFKLLEIYQIDLSKHRILIVGDGKLVGHPLGRILRERNIPFDQADIKTTNLSEKLQRATLIITATGATGLIKPGDISYGVVLVDAGTSEANGKMAGDTEPECAAKCSYYAPVPGGVGPLTILMLMANVVAAAEGSFRA